MNSLLSDLAGYYYNTEYGVMESGVTSKYPYYELELYSISDHCGLILYALEDQVRYEES